MKFGGFIVFYYVKNCLFVENNGSLHFIIHVAEKLCCEWTTLFILIVTDTQRRLIAALVIDERRKNSAK